MEGDDVLSAGCWVLGTTVGSGELVAQATEYNAIAVRNRMFRIVRSLPLAPGYVMSIFRLTETLWTSEVSPSSSFWVCDSMTPAVSSNDSVTRTDFVRGMMPGGTCTLSERCTLRFGFNASRSASASRF